MSIGGERVALAALLGGWALGATVGVGTLAVILLLGPAVDLAARLLSLDLHQAPEPQRAS